MADTPDIPILRTAIRRAAREYAIVPERATAPEQAARCYLWCESIAGKRVLTVAMGVRMG